MKKIFVSFTLVFLFFSSMGQGYYDALKIASFTGYIDPNTKKHVLTINENNLRTLEVIMSNYGLKEDQSRTNAELRKAIKKIFDDSNNPFLIVSATGQSDDDFNTLSTKASDLVSFPSNISGLNVTNIADGLAKFLVERTKQELTISFFDKFREELESEEELKAIFPKTHSLLLTLGDDIYNFSGYINMLRETFQEDLKNIIPNLRTLLKSNKLNDYFKINPTIKVILNNALLIAEDLQNGKHPGDVITSLKDENLNEKTIRNFTPSIQLLDLFSQSLKSLQEDRYWVSSDSLKLLINNKTALKIYLGLLYQQSANIKFEPKNGNGEEGFRTILTNIHTTYSINEEPVKTYLKTLIANAESVDRNLKAIKEMNSKEGLQSGYSEHYQFYNASIDLIAHSLTIQSIPAVADLVYFDVTGITKYFDIARTAGDLYLDVREKNYFSAVINLNVILEKSIPSYESQLIATIDQINDLNNIIESVTDVPTSNEATDKILAFLKLQGAYLEKESDFKDLEVSINTLRSAYNRANRDDVKAKLGIVSTFFTDKKSQIPAGLMSKYNEILPKILKYGNLAASIAKAESSDEIQNIIEAIALPAGSARIKRNSKYNVALNAYMGLHYGEEYLRDLETSPHWGKIYGLSTPIGIASSWGLKTKKHELGSISLFASIIDIGAIASFRFSDDEAEEIPELKFENIIAPGAYLIWGFPKVPISLGYGWQVGPQLREIRVVDNNGLENTMTSQAYRWNFFLAVDIPLLNFYTKSK